MGKGNQMTALRFLTGGFIRNPWPLLGVVLSQIRQNVEIPDRGYIQNPWPLFRVVLSQIRQNVEIPDRGYIRNPQPLFRVVLSQIRQNVEIPDKGVHTKSLASVQGCFVTDQTKC